MIENIKVHIFCNKFIAIERQREGKEEKVSTLWDVSPPAISITLDQFGLQLKLRFPTILIYHFSSNLALKIKVIYQIKT